METTTVSEQSQNSTSSPSDSSGSPQQTYTSTPPVTEKMIPQSKVDEIVRHANANVADKARRDALAEYQRQQSTAQPQQTAQQYAPVSTPDINDLVAQKIDARFQELQSNYQITQQNEMALKISNDFNARMSATKDSYPDFESVTQTFPFAAYPNSVISSMNFDNTGDIMYELAKNPSKLELIDSLAKRDAENVKLGINSNLAHREMFKISEAMKINKTAKNEKTANSPLSHLQSSPTGTDNGLNTVADYQLMLKKRRR